MKKFSLILIAILISFASCTSSDDGEPNAGPLDGKWVLKNAICFCFFGDEFDFGRHRLFIDQANNKMRIENLGDIHFINETGDYSFEIIENELVLDEQRKYTYEQNGNSLTLTYVDNPTLADDEITLEYIKIN